MLYHVKLVSELHHGAVFLIDSALICCTVDKT